MFKLNHRRHTKHIRHGFNQNKRRDGLCFAMTTDIYWMAALARQGPSTASPSHLGIYASFAETNKYSAKGVTQRQDSQAMHKNSCRSHFKSFQLSLTTTWQRGS